jgi:hypothetical protein
MADKRPPRQDRKLLYIAPVVIAAIVAVLAITLSHEPTAPMQPVVPKASSVPAAVRAQSAIAAAPPPLTRAELIQGAAQAAGTFAAEGKLPDSVDSLVGRRFSIRIAFGCGGTFAGNGMAQASVTFDAIKQTVILTARPGVWTGLPLLQGLGDAASIEAAEGFWLPRPWSSDDACPPNTVYLAPATPTPPAAQTVGLVQLFTGDSSRAGRHADHPYEFRRKIPSDDTSMLGHAYRLVLEGTIIGYSNDHGLHCWMESPEHRPLCLYAVTFDHVAFQDDVTGDILANWSD